MGEPVAILRPTMTQRAIRTGLGVLLLAGTALGATAVTVWEPVRIGELSFLLLVAVAVIASALFARLELSTEGFREWSLIARWIRWSDIEDLRPERRFRAPDVVTYAWRPGTDTRPAIFRRLSGRGGVSASYGLNALEQCRLMEQLRTKSHATDGR